MIEIFYFHAAYFLFKLSNSIRKFGCYLLWLHQNRAERKMAYMTDAERELYLNRLNRKNSCSQK